MTRLLQHLRLSQFVSTRTNNTTAEIAKLSLSENARALSISPLNVNYWKSKTKIYYSFSSLNPAFITEAINALAKAHELSPNDPKIEYNLAILYGRQGDSAKAVSLLRHAIALKPIS
jgi:Flp pilus assembly protein TadD